MTGTDRWAPGGAAPMVVAEQLTRDYPSGDTVVHALRSIELAVGRGELMAVKGRSGSGKTTLLRCINFLEEPTVGAIEIDGVRVEADPLHSRDRAHQERIRQIRLRAGMLFQEFNLFPHMTTLGNCIEAPTQVLRTPRAEAVQRAEYFLELVGLADKRDQHPSRL